MSLSLSNKRKKQKRIAGRWSHYIRRYHEECVFLDCIRGIFCIIFTNRTLTEYRWMGYRPIHIQEMGRFYRQCELVAKTIYVFCHHVFCHQAFSLARSRWTSLRYARVYAQVQLGDPCCRLFPAVTDELNAGQLFFIPFRFSFSSSCFPLMFPHN